MDIRLKLFRGYWTAVWREDGETKRRSLRTQDRAVAERAIAGFQVAQRQPTGQTVGAIYASYLVEKGSPRAIWAWRQMSPSFEHMLPDQVTRESCKSYITRRHKDGVSNGTIHTELTFLRAALRWVDKNTVAEVILPTKPAPQEYYLTRAEYDRLFSAATTPHVRLFIALALATAGRMTAILELTWDRIDFERGTIRLSFFSERRRKGRATVPMTTRARSELMAAYEARTSDFVIEYGGKQVGKIRKSFMAAAASAGLPDCTPHVLRHTAAVWMAEAGVPMVEIAQYLGHTDSRITEKVYARFSPEHLRSAAVALDH